MKYTFFTVVSSTSSKQSTGVSFSNAVGLSTFRTANRLYQTDRFDKRAAATDM
jgi:hypothetical protein